MHSRLRTRIARLEGSIAADTPVFGPIAFQIVSVPAVDGHPVPGWTPRDEDIRTLHVPAYAAPLKPGRRSWRLRRRHHA